MGIVSKEGYERKAMYAEKKAYENQEIGIDNGLTEKQCETLDTLCSIRHEMHCNQEDFFISGSCNYSQFWSYINDDNEINIMLKEANLPTIDFSKVNTFSASDYDYLDYDNDLDEYEEYSEEWENRKEELYQKSLDAVLEEAEKINTLIEKYLYEIDQKYGTSYRPSGFSRLK